MGDRRPQHATDLSQDGPSRRTVVLGVSAVGAAAFLTACGGGSGAASADLPGGSSSGAPASSPSGGAAGSPLAKTAEVPVGGGKILKDPQVVITQPTRGTFKAFSSICRHQGCPVGAVTKNKIICPCHGSEYDAATGQPVQGPNGQPASTIGALPAVPITVQGDEVVQA
jgi:nitrite reductase/ring-hydroxylating ferredoxin subunit